MFIDGITIGQLNELLDNKQQEMVEFLTRYLSESEVNRIGEDIIRIMPGSGDVAKIQMKNLSNKNT